MMRRVDINTVVGAGTAYRTDVIYPAVADQYILSVSENALGAGSRIFGFGYIVYIEVFEVNITAGSLNPNSCALVSAYFEV